MDCFCFASALSGYYVSLRLSFWKPPDLPGKVPLLTVYSSTTHSMEVKNLPIRSENSLHTPYRRVWRPRSNGRVTVIGRLRSNILRQFSRHSWTVSKILPFSARTLESNIGKVSQYPFWESIEECSGSIPMHSSPLLVRQVIHRSSVTASSRVLEDL